MWKHFTELDYRLLGGEMESEHGRTEEGVGPLGRSGDEVAKPL